MLPSGNKKTMLTPAEIEKRRSDLRAEELLTQPRRPWYVSFAKPKEEGGWQGGAIVFAQGITTALDRCNVLGINPGGSVQAIECPGPVVPGLMDRLLNRREMEAAFGELRHMPTSHPVVCSCAECSEVQYAGKIGPIPLPNLDYSCGAAFCDDPCCNTHGAKDADDKLLYWTPQRLMAKKAEMRPPNYANLSPQQQWEVDGRLGILDWDGEGV